jgi:hypothetical protein
MNKATITVKVVSPCGTYRETIKCRTMDEARGYKTALEADGSTVTIEGMCFDGAACDDFPCSRCPAAEQFRPEHLAGADSMWSPAA